MPFTAFRRHPLITPLAILVAGMLMFPVFTIAYAGYAAHRQQQAWCLLLHNITTGNPAPPHVAPPGPGASLAQKSAYRNYRIYEDLNALRKSFGCF